MIKQIDNWVATEHGSRRGLAHNTLFQAMYFMGRYRDYKDINWESIDRLVFICKGNICRSAYAEAVAHARGIPAASFGVETRDGVPANEDAVRAAASKGIDLTRHRTTSIQSSDFRDNDFFIAMEPWQISRVVEKKGNSRNCSLLGLWGSPVRPYIHDPYGSSDAHFIKCFDYIEKSIDEIASKVS